GTNGLGLVLFDRDRGTCKTFTTKDGLSDNCIKTIMEDEAGNLWLAGNNDISKFNIYTHKAIPYTINDGLPPCSFFHHSTFKDKYGKIYFGTNEGYLIINPKLSVEQTSFPKVVLTELR